VKRARVKKQTRPKRTLADVVGGIVPNVMRAKPPVRLGELPGCAHEKAIVTHLGVLWTVYECLVCRAQWKTATDN
jgi:hypothetical protein